jgi:tripartite-type tricarboxylate transporter receptor subunit TctC
MQLKKYLGVHVIIQNVPGASGRVGLTKLYRSKPDGYTIGGTTLPNIQLIEILTKAEFQSNKFTKIFAWTVSNAALAVPADRWNTLEEFVGAAKSKPLSCGISGIGGSSHLAGLVLEAALGVKFNWVPFSSGAEAATSLAGKHIDAATLTTASILPLQRAGKIKSLTVLAQERDKTMPEIPTPKELGYKYSSMPSVNGVSGPPGLGADKVKILEAAFARAVKEPEYIEWSQRTGTPIDVKSANEFARLTEETTKEVVKFGYLLGK